MKKRLCCAAALSFAMCAAGCYDVFSDARIVRQSGNDDPSGTGGAGGTTTNPACVPNQTGDPIDDACGVFVSAANGDDAKDGETTSTAVATLKRAIEVAKGQPIYACADAAKAFEEALTLDGQVVLFGGLDCASWTYAAGTKTKWTAAADEVPLHVKPTGSVTIADVVIEAANATKEGGSSIALLAEGGASVELSRCEVTAGDGKAGETPMAPSGTGTPGMPGVNGKDGCLSVDDLTGGKGGALTCEPANDVSGGVGGQGLTASSGGAGSDGLPAGAGGKAGKGQSFDGMPATACENGGDGAEGLAGDPGVGAAANGVISESGYTGEPGNENGTAGKPGQGGGGGGGAKKCSGGFAGPSAGGGGSGGCGGNAGKGGGAGGASIAIVSLGATLLLSDVKVTSHAGGKGGDGGLGQPGGDGGLGGMPGSHNGDATALACSGGKGGKGGTGGRGGGGRGGPSIGIAFTGAMPDTKGATVMAGTPGEGGQGDGAAGSGAKGMTAPTQSF